MNRAAGLSCDPACARTAKKIWGERELDRDWERKRDKETCTEKTEKVRQLERES